MDDFQFQVIDSIGEVNIYDEDADFVKMEISRHCPGNYDLYLSFLESRRIFFCKFIVEGPLLFQPSKVSKSVDRTHKVKLGLPSWKVLCLPFNLKDFFISNKHFWVQGESFYADIYPNTCAIYEENISEDLMDIDEVSEFQATDFVFQVTVPQESVHAVSKTAICLNCDLFDGSIINCVEDHLKNSWRFDLILVDNLTARRKIINLPSLLYSYRTKPNNVTYNEDELRKRVSPVILFIDGTHITHDLAETSLNLVNGLLDMDPSLSSNCIGLFGHPEGCVFFFLCSKLENDLKINTSLKELCNVNQTIKGMHFVEEIKGIQEKGFLFIVGAQGKMSIVTKSKVWKHSSAIRTSFSSFFLSTLYLQSSVKKYILFRDCIFYISPDSRLFITKFFTLIDSDDETNELGFGQSSAIMSDVLDIVLLNNSEGLFLILTKQGSLYVSEYAEKTRYPEKLVSLPTLINEIIHQNTRLHSLSTTRLSLTSFFQALSVFASLKYNNFLNLEILCSITQTEEFLQKFQLNITVHGFKGTGDKFWRLVVTLRHWHANTTVLSKTSPLVNGQKVSIPVQKSYLCSSQESLFPLFIEVGLLLIWPDSPFPVLQDQLPLYLCVKKFTLNELLLLKHMLSATKFEKDPFLSLNTTVQRPITQLFEKKQVNVQVYYPNQFCIFLLESFTRELVKINSGSYREESILQILESKRNPADNKSSSMFQNGLLSLTATQMNDKICVVFCSELFPILAGLRLSLLEAFSNEHKEVSEDDHYISIPASLKEVCEKLNQDFLIMHEKSLQSNEFMVELIQKYTELRNKVSSALPFC